MPSVVHSVVFSMRIVAGNSSLLAEFSDGATTGLSSLQGREFLRLLTVLAIAVFVALICNRLVNRQPKPFCDSSDSDSPDAITDRVGRSSTMWCICSIFMQWNWDSLGKRGQHMEGGR